MKNWDRYTEVWEMCHTLTDWFYQGSDARWKPSTPAVQKGKETQRGSKAETTSTRHSSCGCECNCYFAWWIYGWIYFALWFYTFSVIFSVSILSYVCVIGHSLPSSLNSSHGTLMTQGELCTHINWKAWTGCDSLGLKEPTQSWLMKWGLARLCRQ